MRGNPRAPADGGPSCNHDAPVSVSRLPLSEPRAAVDNHLLALTGCASSRRSPSTSRTSAPAGLAGLASRAPRERLLRRDRLLRSLRLRPGSSTTGIGSTRPLRAACGRSRWLGSRASTPCTCWSSRISRVKTHVRLGPPPSRLALASGRLQAWLPNFYEAFALRPQLVRSAWSSSSMPSLPLLALGLRRLVSVRQLAYRNRASTISRCSRSRRGSREQAAARRCRSTDTASAHFWLYRLPSTRLGVFLPRHLRRAPLRQTCADGCT